MHFTGRTWRPPYEKYSAIIQITSGCTYNKCTFCNLYKEEQFCLSPLAEFEEDLDELKRFQPHARRIFLTGANPFALPYEKLLLYARTIRDYLIKCQTIAMFASIRDIKRKSIDELRKLRAAGVNGLTIGLESADDETLILANKGYTASDILEQCKKLDQAGIEYYFIYMTGLAGAGNGERNALNTAEVINQLNSYILGIDSLILFPDTDLFKLVQSGLYEVASEKGRLKELLVLLEALQIKVHLEADTSSNFLPLNGPLPKMKGEFIDIINDAINQIPEKEMRSYRKSLL